MEKIAYEEKLFDLFCEKFGIKSLYNRPFLNTICNEVWATNGYMMVTVKPGLLYGTYDTDCVNLVKTGMPCSHIVTFEAIKTALSKLPTVEEEEDAKYVKCDECDDEPKKMEWLIPDFCTPIRLGGEYFRGDRINILAQAMELLGLDKLTMTHHASVHNGDKACELQAEGVHFFIMPMRVNGEIQDEISIEI